MKCHGPSRYIPIRRSFRPLPLPDVRKCHGPPRFRLSGPAGRRNDFVHIMFLIGCQEVIAPSAPKRAGPAPASHSLRYRPERPGVWCFGRRLPYMRHPPPAVRPASARPWDRRSLYAEDERLRFAVAIEAGEDSFFAECRRIRGEPSRWLHVAVVVPAGTCVGLSDRSRAPRRRPRAMSEEVVTACLERASSRRRVLGLEHKSRKIVMTKEENCVAHYSKLKHLANILHDKKLLVGPVCKMADPREASMSWLDSEGIGHGPDSENRQAANEMISRAGHQLRLLCTTGAGEPDSADRSPIESAIYGRPRMWAQYGDQSRGFCIVLNREKLHKELRKLVERDEHLISGEIEYSVWLHMVEGGSTIEFEPERDPRDLDVFEVMNENNMLQSVYFRKSIDWRDEGEYRWLLFSQTEKEVYVSIRNSIKAVVLGSQFPPNQESQAINYCQEIGSSCYRLEYRHPKYKKLVIFEPR